MPGRFISLEGGEGVGKSTQARLLAQALRERGHEVLLTREPGGTPGAEAIRALLLDSSGSGWNAAAEALLFAAARSDHVERVIRPALEKGVWVICDRFLDSSRAYQAGEGAMSDADIMELHRVGSGGLLPDMTLLLETDPGVAHARQVARDGTEGDRIEARDAAYHARVAARFVALAEAEPRRFLRLSTESAREEVHRTILQVIEDRFEQAP